MATNFKPLQAQTFSLAGGGAIAGATTVILKSFQTIDGVNIAMSNLGLIAFMTLEPGMGINEEQISFTGVNQNANGTATLTGVKTVLFEYPYTQTSGLAKTHAGSTTAVLSNTSGFYNQFVAKDDDGTISETIIFTTPNYPRMTAATPLPTDQEQLATKAYVDSVVVAGAPDATTIVKGIVQLPTQAQVDAKTALGSTGAALVVTPATQRSTNLSDYVPDTGAADAYIITPSPAVSSLVAGQRFTFKVANANTGSSTIVVNGLTGTAIYKAGGSTTLAAGDLAAGQIVEIEYNGINGFMLLNPVANTVSLTNGAYPAGDGSLITNVHYLEAQLFTVDGTWTKPSGAMSVEVFLIGGGAGGGGGTRQTSANGGGGGGGGAFVYKRYLASALATTEPVDVGAAGTGGAGEPASSTGDGTNGTSGAATIFSSGGTVLTANGGTLGQSGGTRTGGAGGTVSAADTIDSYLLAGGAGANGGAGAGNGSAATSLTTLPASGRGGGGGGGAASSNQTGGAGGTNTHTTFHTVYGFQPLHNGANIIFSYLLGTAGGAGGVGIGTGGGPAGGNGVAGTNYGSGGGGGGGKDTDDGAQKAGDGGNGAPGLCIVISYF